MTTDELFQKQMVQDQLDQCRKTLVSMYFLFLISWLFLSRWCVSKCARSVHGFSGIFPNPKNR